MGKGTRRAEAGLAAAAVATMLAAVLTTVGLVLSPAGRQPDASVLPVRAAAAAGGSDRQHGTAAIGSQPAVATALPASDLVAVSVPAIDLHARSIVDLRLTPAGAMEVPSTAGMVGWFARSETPGEPGAAVLAGHVEFAYERGVFYRLHELRPGDTVTAHRADGTRAEFTVFRIERNRSAESAVELATAPTSRPELRLVTSSAEGPRSAAHGHLVVFAVLTATRGDASAE